MGLLHEQKDQFQYIFIYITGTYQFIYMYFI